MNKYYCLITDKYYSQAQIDANLSKTYKALHQLGENGVCMGCGKTAQDNSHTISQKRCKHLHKVSLIWNPKNIVSLCRACHIAYENGGPKAEQLFCYIDCMEFMELHDEEGFNKYKYLK